MCPWGGGDVQALVYMPKSLKKSSPLFPVFIGGGDAGIPAVELALPNDEAEVLRVAVGAGGGGARFCWAVGAG